MKALLDAIADPLVWTVLLLLGGGLWALRRRARRLAGTLLFGGLLLAALGSGPGARALLSPLEDLYPALLSPPAVEVDWIAVLAGGEGWAPGRPITSDLSTSSAARLLEAVRVWRMLDETPKILFVGGIGRPGRRAEAPLVGQAALALGVPEDAIDWEAASRNTHENALAIANLIGEEPVILVTSAFHMPRAMAACRAAGLSPVPAPCGHRAPKQLSPYDYIPASEYLWDSALAIREYLALLYYRLRGWI